MASYAKPRSFVFIVMAVCLVFLCLMSQEIFATSRSLLISREDEVAGGSYNDRITTTKELMKKKKKTVTMGEYGGEDYESSPHDYSDYDFYRKHGDVPSPGAGH